METVLLYIVGILIIAVGLILSIGLHEMGHLIPAKLFGVRVGQYMIGFGPTLWSKLIRGTEYGVKAVPLGGYISMAGMYPPKDGDPEHARTATTGFMQTLVQDAPPPAIAAAGEVVDDRSAAVVPGGYTEKAVDENDPRHSFYAKPIWQRIIIMLGGPTVNLLIGIVLYALLLCGFGVQQASTTIGSVSECVISASSTDQTTCSADDPAAPGAAAGIKPGDRLISIDGTAVTSWDQATALIQKSAGDALTIVVERDGAETTVTATPLLTERYVYDAQGNVVKDASGASETQDVGFLGIGAATETVRQPITAVLPTVGDNIGRVVGIIANLPQRLVAVAQAAFGSGERDPNGPVSVVGVGRLAGEIASIDSVPLADRAAALIGLVASLNIALFVFNLIPLLPLDGGHVLGALWDGLRRAIARLRKQPMPRPIDITRLMPLTMAVVVILGGMSLLLVYADIVKPITIQ